MADQDKRARNRIRYAQQQHRGAILKHARELARSGEYAGSQSIIAKLKATEGFEIARARLEDPEFRAQLDRLCDMARKEN